MTKLRLEFSEQRATAELRRTGFWHPSLERPRRAQLGDEFQWTAGVQALAIFLLEAAECAAAGVACRPLCGTRPSPAVSLYEAREQARSSRKNKWVPAMFGPKVRLGFIEGAGADAKSLGKHPIRLTLQTNSEAQPPLSPRRIVVYLDGRRLTAADEFAALRLDVERQWQVQNASGRARRSYDADDANRDLIKAEALYLDHDDWEGARDAAIAVEASFSKHGDERTDAEARLLHAHLEIEAGHFDLAQRHADEALARFDDLDDAAGAGSAQNTLAVIHDALGDWNRAREGYDLALERFEHPRCPLAAACLTTNRSVAEFFLDGPEYAQRTCLEALETLGGRNVPRESAYGALNLAIYFLALGDRDSAQDLLDAGQEWTRQHGEQWYALNLGQMRAVHQMLCGRPGRALDWLDEVERRARRIARQDYWFAIDLSINRALALLGRGRAGDRTRAESLLARSLREARDRRYALGEALARHELEREFGGAETDGDVAPAMLPAAAFPNELFMPCYALSLRAKLLRGAPLPVPRRGRRRESAKTIERSRPH